ncbi:hypothetical protein FNV43_RR16252 [Rhamnella rubrinervis]|uniref:Uncharacterized protein n=1 Tax=Rhamnella rubrinervis TaxID=2594499 RepID=A0A8K0E912_9ROSA|nr:hypothetical protein FNV43_RR16252 [Rhamnella rubrinervis]
MLSCSLSCSHGRRSFRYGESPNPDTNSSQTRAKLPQLLFFPSLQPSPPPPSSSSFQLSVRSQYQSQSPLVKNQPTWVPPASLIPNTSTTKTPKLALPPLRSGISSDSYSTNSGGSFGDWIGLIGEAVSTAFPIWVALGCLLGLIKPSSFNWVQPKYTVLGITLTMLGMGMTLTLDDLRGALAMPKELLAGFVLQYSVSMVVRFNMFTVGHGHAFVEYLRLLFVQGLPLRTIIPRSKQNVMPISGFLVSKLLNLPSHYAAGLILVGCCPGGTASNIVTYIARGNVALSVLMTAASTLTAVLAKLAGQYVAVDAAGLLMSTLQVVLLPVLAGAFLNQYFQGLSSSAILASGKQVVLAASLLHASGFFFGYILSRMLGIDVASSRTISIEVGMQNSVLGVVLATQHFGNPLTAVPCAVSSVCHSIFGSVLAGIWRRSVPIQKQE